MPLVMLRGGWPGTFRRQLSPDERLEFPPGVPVELTRQQHEALQASGDLAALVYVRLDEKGRPKVVDQPVEAPPIKSEAPGPLDNLTMDELRALAGEQGLDVSHIRKKRELIAALSDA